MDVLTQPLHLPLKQLERNLRQNARSVASARIGGHGTPVGDILHTGQCHPEDPVGPRPARIRYKAHTTAVMLHPGLVQQVGQGSMSSHSRAVLRGSHQFPITRA